MFNTKKIEALGEMVAGLETWLDGFNKRLSTMEKKEIPNIISCSTCKCLIRKEDAIKGKSEVRYKQGDTFHEAIVASLMNKEPAEYIFTPFYCHSKDCKPKK